jgi:imidazolonepropionase-like amidohydrolase
MLNFLVKPGDDTRTLARFDIVAQNAYRLDLATPAVRSFVALLKERKTVLDPTLAAFEGMFVQRQGEMNPSYATIADHLPLATQRFNRTNSMKVPADSIGKYRDSYAKMIEMVGLMHREGVPLVAGTDAMAGFTLHRELELYAKAGIPAAEALRIATWNGAKYTRTLDRVVSISPGKQTDVILIEGDPTKDVSAVRSVNLVMRGGVVYFPSEIYDAMGIQPFVKPIKPEVAEK